MFRRARSIDPQSIHVAYNFTLMLLHQQRSGEAADLWVRFRKLQNNVVAKNPDSRVQNGPGVVAALVSESDAARLDDVVLRMAKQELMKAQLLTF